MEAKQRWWLLVALGLGGYFLPETIWAEPAAAQQMVIGTLVTDDKNVKLGGFPVFFGGSYMFTDNNGRFQMPAAVDFLSQPLYILVSSGVKWDFLKGEKTVSSKTLSLALHDPALPHKFYKIVWQKTEQGNVAVDFSEEDLGQSNYRIPISQCVFLTVNRFFVEGLKKPAIAGKDGILHLPKIKLASEKSLQDSKSAFLLAQNTAPAIHDFKVKNIMERGKAKATLRFADWLTFHAPVIKCCQSTTNKLGRNVEITGYARA